MSDYENNRPLTTGEWFLTILILGLPVVGLVMHFIWAFTDGNLGRRNFCRATLLWLAVLAGIGIVVLFGMLLVGGLLAGAGAAASR